MLDRDACMPDTLSNSKIPMGVELAVGRLDSLSILPCVGTKLYSRLLEGQFSPSSLSDIADADPALAAKALLLIGGRAAGRADRGLSPGQALSKLSAHEVRDAILSLKVMQSFGIDQPAEKQAAEIRKGLGLHSLAVACAAKAIAEIALPPEDEWSAYCAGLLHDIGKLALQDAMPKSLARIFEEARSAVESACAVESRHLGTDHTLLGKHLAQKWRLPQPVIVSVWLHHNRSVIISENISEVRMAAVVQLADIIARQSGIGISGSFDSPEPVEPIAGYLGIDMERLEKIRENLTAEVARRSQVLNLDTPNAAADYCRAACTAAAHFAGRYSELSADNQKLQSDSSHFNFIADFLKSITSTSRAIDIAESFAVRWQKFYQTGSVCLYLLPPPRHRAFEAVIVESLSQSRIAAVDVPLEEPTMPKEIAGDFGIVNAYEHIDWLFEQLDTDFDVNRTRLLPLISSGKAIGALAFELHYPADAESFAEKFKTSASIAAAVLDIAMAADRQQHFAEQFARLISKPAEIPRPTRTGAERAVHAGDLLTALAEMAAGAAHELNNPLAVISGRAQLLAEADSDKETKEILRQIYENAREASGIIEDLMSFAEPPRPRPTRTDVKRVLDEAVQLTNRKTGVEVIDVKIDAGEEVESVYADSAQIVSAVANIIANAVESYREKQGPIEITAVAGEPGGPVTLTIQDHGCGMDEATLKKASQPFFSAKPAGRKRGMGLAYAARFIQMNKGTLNIESRAGEGTRVTIQLPTK